MEKTENMNKVSKMWFLMLNMFCLCTYAQTKLTDTLPQDKEVRIGTLENGLTYYIRKNTEPKNRAQLNLVVNTGSLEEREDQRGLAHFTEHMAFNGTKSFPKNELITYLERSGVKFGADLNAFTGFDKTVYQLPIPTDDDTLFHNAFKILSEWAHEISFEPDEIDKERGVIMEEERQRGKNASERIQKRLIPLLFANSKYEKRLPIGTPEVIENFNHKALIDYYNKWYRPDHQAIIAVGDFNVDKVENLIVENFSDIPSSQTPLKNEKYSIPDNEAPRVEIITDPEFPYTVASIIYKLPENVIKTKENLKLAVKRSAVNSMINSRIQEKINNTEVPFLNASAGFGAFQGGAGNLDAFEIHITSKDAKSLQASVREVMNEIRKVEQFGFTQTEWLRVQKSFIASIDKTFKEKDKISSQSYLNNYIKNFTTGEAIIPLKYTYNFYHTELKKISLAEINKLASELTPEKNQILFIRSSEKTKEELPSEEEFINWVNSKDEKLENYVDNYVDEPLISETLIPGSITKIKEYKNQNITELTLNNGARVILKPTDFKNDEILFHAFSPGGYSLAKEANITTAKLADVIVPSSGLGKFNSSQLNKFLTGKSLSLTPYISTYSEGIKGSVSPKDFETAMQLLYLFFDAPRIDSTAFNRIVEQNEIAIKNKSQNPIAVFQDSINRVIQGNSSYSAPITVADLKNLEMDNVHRVFTERISSPNDFVYVFTGSFKKDAIIPVIQKYIGSLKSKKAREKYRDVGIKPQAGKISKVIRKGLEDKATTVVVYHNNYDFNQRNNLVLKLIKSALETKLMKSLREEAGATYSPSVNVSYTQTPKPYYTLSITYTSAVDNVDKMMAVTHQTIEDLRKSGLDKGDLKKFISQQKREFETKIRTNDFWLNYIHNTYFNDLPINRIDNYQRELDKLTISNVQEQISKFLNTENIVDMVLEPEKNIIQQ